MSRLQNKVVVITGGTSGIGLSSARRFVDEGAHVFIFGRRKQELDKAVELIGRNVTAVQGDARKIEDLDRLFSRVQAEKGHLDVLVASAGVVEVQMFGEVTADSYDKIFDLNVRGLLNEVQQLEAIILRATTLDTGFDPADMQDQTWTGRSECGLEIVLWKPTA